MDYGEVFQMFQFFKFLPEYCFVFVYLKKTFYSVWKLPGCFLSFRSSSSVGGYVLFVLFQ